MVDVPAAGESALGPPGEFALLQRVAAAEIPGPAVPPDITSVAAEVRRRGRVGPAGLPANPAPPAAGAQNFLTGRPLRQGISQHISPSPHVGRNELLVQAGAVPFGCRARGDDVDMPAYRSRCADGPRSARCGVAAGPSWPDPINQILTKHGGRA